MGFDLFCLGGCSVDLIVKSMRLPLADEKLVVEYCGREPGGLVANTACAAARLGLETGWSGLVGDDDYGRMILDDFHRFGVDVSNVVVLEATETDFTVIILDDNGNRTILVVPVIQQALPLMPPTLRALSTSKFGYSIPHEAEWFGQFSSAVKMGGGKVVVDLEGSSPVKGDGLREVLQKTDITFCSLDGLELGSGTKDPEEGARRLLGLGQELVVVTEGKKGSEVFSKDGSWRSPAFPVQAVDTTGAGDCFHAAFLTGLGKKWGYTKILRFANAAAAISVQGIGARGILPTIPDIEAFLTSRGEK